jgi:hypothetical protein
MASRMREYEQMEKHWQGLERSGPLVHNTIRSLFCIALAKECVVCQIVDFGSRITTRNMLIHGDQI